jgi:uncharacterized protein YbbC (DUF1343 family)
MKRWFYLLLLLATAGRAQTGTKIIPAAERISLYLPLLQQKGVAVFANQTSVVGGTHLVDTLQRLGVRIVKIFSPEHGFRGNADAGEEVGNYTDKATGLPVISLYGKKSKPSEEDLQGVDLVLFDIQDVGVRFYTYISSLEDLMNAVLEQQKELVVLDRPNPNGGYVDGPVLDTAYRSFIGRQPIPVVYGMTIGEYARMLVGEQWLSAKASRYGKAGGGKSKTRPLFRVIPCDQYTHAAVYALPVKPSPNLPTASAVAAYPSTCFFEGTVLSEGRGTPHPFEIFGHPLLPDSLFSFTPQPTAGARNPKLKGQQCYGWNISGRATHSLRLELGWLLEAYRLFPAKDRFFILPKEGSDKDVFFNKLAGNNRLMQQIIQGVNEAAIRKSWQPALDRFRKIRAKYLLYR